MPNNDKQDLVYNKWSSHSKIFQLPWNLLYIYIYIYIYIIFIVAEYSLGRRRKWRTVPRTHLYIGSTVCLKPCLNLCSFKWLKFSVRHGSSFIPLCHNEKNDFFLCLIKLRIISLIFFIDTMFRIYSLSAHHSLMKCG